jgi:hypothetical protein
MTNEPMSNEPMSNEGMNDDGLRRARFLEGKGKFAWRKRC